jgi:PAS domain S-box-containing protein
MTGLPEDLWRRILEGSPDALLVSDREGVIRGWNAAATRLFGHEEAEVLGRSMDLIIPERLRGRHWDGFNQVMATGTTRYGAGQLLAVPAAHKDGRQLSVEFSIQLLRGGSGQIEWVVALFRDVTDRFQREKALKAKLRSLEEKAGMTRPKLVKRLDVRPLKAAGIHPVEQVLKDLSALAAGEAYELVTPHLPGPVVERAAAFGVKGVTVETGPEEFVTTFTREG